MRDPPTGFNWDSSRADRFASCRAVFAVFASARRGGKKTSKTGAPTAGGERPSLDATGGSIRHGRRRYGRGEQSRDFFCVVLERLFDLLS